MLLILSPLKSFYLQVNRIWAVHETVCIQLFSYGRWPHRTWSSMTLGKPCGSQMATARIQSQYSLQSTPTPIVLNAGYEHRQSSTPYLPTSAKIHSHSTTEQLFRNFGPVITFAFLGIFISVVGFGSLSWTSVRKRGGDSTSPQR